MSYQHRGNCPKDLKSVLFNTGFLVGDGEFEALRSKKIIKLQNNNKSNKTRASQLRQEKNFRSIKYNHFTKYYKLKFYSLNLPLKVSMVIILEKDPYATPTCLHIATPEFIYLFLLYWNKLLLNLCHQYSPTDTMDKPISNTIATLPKFSRLNHDSPLNIQRTIS